MSPRLLVFSSLVLAACDPIGEPGTDTDAGTSPLVDAAMPSVSDAGDAATDASTSDAATSDAMTSDAGAMSDAGVIGLTEIAFTLPPEGVRYVDGSVAIQLAVTGQVPDRVELLRNGSLFAVLTPPYTHTWDATLESEGERTLTARAIVGDTTTGEASRVFEIDRTPPAVVARFPAPGSRAAVFRPITVEVSEPLDPSSVSSETVVLTARGSPLASDVELSADGMTIRIQPTATPTPYPAMARLELLSGITDLAGRDLAPEHFQFTYDQWGPLTELPFVSAATFVYDVFTPDATNLWVVYSVSMGGTRVPAAARWDGTSWTDMIGGPIAPGVVRAEIVVDGSGAPFVVVYGADESAENRIMVRRYDAVTDAWTELPAPALPDGVNYSMDLELDDAGAFHLARRGNSQARVDVYSGGSWAAAGAPIAVTTAQPTYIDIQPHPDGTYMSLGNAGACQQYRFTGTDWTQGPDFHSSSCGLVALGRGGDGLVRASGYYTFFDVSLNMFRRGIWHHDTGETFLTVLMSTGPYFSVQFAATPTGVYGLHRGLPIGSDPGQSVVDDLYQNIFYAPPPLTARTFLVYLDGVPMILTGDPPALWRPNLLDDTPPL